ncbi:hypothetical protein QSU92_10930 [Microbacterium sp. ET2]|uniref:hypothetical protein n=1 Tax=Microbacterium albipurpureum TaxID=3050384 RepID=UPI00259CFA9F|nr:hypothetical protein [Microbacterium sp. ET2 (Ac-2212)]WJL94486.1 hypothetical protein QSU92_10930 [Microbacterium sp. ET2 (Ac-2212)]
MRCPQLLQIGGRRRRHAERKVHGRRFCRSSVALAVGLLLTGCAGGGEPGDAASPGAPALPDGVTVEIVQLRADVAVRQAQVHVVNDGDTDLEIGEVAVDDPRFVAPASRVLPGRTSRVPAGGEVDIRVQLPEVACSAREADTADSTAEPTVELTFLADGIESTARVAAADPLGFLAPLHERECRAAALAEAATLEFTGFAPAATGAPATLELTATPTGRGGEATVVAVQATNLLDFGPATVDGAFPLDLRVSPGDAEPVVVDIPILPSRCDPHAVQEDKRGTIFDVRLSIDGEPGEIELFVGDALRGDILTWVSSWCGFSGSD